MTSLLWSFAAWCALALAIERHHERVFPRPGGAVSRPAWCGIGLAGALAALAAPVLSQGWPRGVLSWVGSMVAGGCAAAALLAWLPQRCVTAAAAALFLGAVLA